MNNTYNIPVWVKYTLSIEEAQHIFALANISFVILSIKIQMQIIFSVMEIVFRLSE